MSLDLLFLGTGTSSGVPIIACDCEVCTSDDPRDKRTRVSVLITYPDPGDARPEQSEGRDQPHIHGSPHQFLIDTGPDLRDQALRHDIRRVDGVLYTHSHGDHIYGIDELRRFNAVMKVPLDIYAEPDVIESLARKFGYIFNPQATNQSFVPQLIPNRIEPGEPLELLGARWTPIRLMHGRLPVLGFRVDWQDRALAYCTDVSTIPPASYPLLEGLDVLVIDALRYRHHPTHMSVDQALEVIDAVSPREAYFTHIAHDVRHAELEPRLPEHVHLAYDGLHVRCGGAAAHQSPSSQQRTAK